MSAVIELAGEPGRRPQRIAPAGGSWVYFLQRGEDGPVKIGHTTDLARRLRALQTACAEPLRLLGIQPGGRGRESMLHRKFAHLRMSGEWFQPGRDLLGFIDRTASSVEEMSLAVAVESHLAYEAHKDPAHAQEPSPMQARFLDDMAALAIDYIDEPTEGLTEIECAEARLRNALYPLPALPRSARPALADALRAENPGMSRKQALRKAEEWIAAIQEKRELARAEAEAEARARLADARGDA